MRVLLAFAFLSLAGAGFAQQTRTPARLATVPPKIDGHVEDSEWSQAATLMGGYDMSTGAADPYGSQYWLAYDREFIYVAAKLPDPDPKQIHATAYRQNVNLSGDDYVIFALDPFGGLTDTNQFEMNANGASNLRIAGGRAAKREWLGEFESKGRITSEGWEVEARIPWAVMRLPSPGTRDLRITFGRVVQRTGRVFFTDNIAGGKETNIGVWEKVDVPKPAIQRSIKLLPYVYGGAEREGLIANAGLDFKAPITQELDLVGSINPDFRNIEQQVLSIDFSYFERLAAESRPFFLEGTEYFATSMDAPLFVSQRIPGFDLGVKAYGKLSGNSTVAVLDTLDLNRQKNTVGAFSYAFSTRTNATIAMTDLESPSLTNRGTFVGFSHSFAPFTVFAQHMTTQDSVEGYGHRYNAGLMLTQGGASNDLEYLEISPNFLPALGFAPERDLKGVLDRFDFSRPVSLGKIREVGLGFGFEDLQTFEHTKYRRSVSLNASAVHASGFAIETGAHYQEFMGFTDRYLNVAAVYPRNSPYRRAALTYVNGFLAGHRYQSWSPSFAYRPLKALQLAGSFQRVDHYTTTQQAIFSANYDVTASDSISGRAVRRGSDTNLYLAYRRTGNTGNEYYLIVGDPNARTFRASVILKAVFPLEFRF